MEDKETQNYLKKSGQKITYQTPPIGERKIVLYLTTVDLEQKEEEKQYIKINDLYSVSRYVNNYNNLNCTRYMHFGWEINNNNNNKIKTVTIVCHKTKRKGD